MSRFVKFVSFLKFVRFVKVYKTEYGIPSSKSFVELVRFEKGL